MEVTMSIAKHIRRKGLNLAELARRAEVPYLSLYRSLGVENPKRELRADELLSVCRELGINPMDFARANDDKN